MGNVTDTGQFICGRCRAVYGGWQRHCVACGEDGSLEPLFDRPGAALVPPPGGMSAKALASTDKETWGVKSYPALKLGPGTLVLAFGPPGAGKSTFGVRVAESLVPSVYLSYEMQTGPAMSEMLRRLECRSPHIWVERPETVNRIVQLSERDGLRCMVVDSGGLCSLLPADWLNLARARGIVILVLLQMVKSGQHAGSAAWLHDCDVCIELNDMSWRVTKSRYQNTSVAGRVLE